MKEIKRKIIIYLLTFLICGAIAFLLYNANHNGKSSSNEKKSTKEEISLNENDENKTFEDKILGIIINEKTYIIELEENETAHEFLLLTPLTIEMEDLNGIQKYYYLNTSLEGKAMEFDNIKKGDIMLNNSNSLIIFYKDTTSKEKYIKIGHINDLDELDENSLSVSFIR